MAPKIHLKACDSDLAVGLIDPANLDSATHPAFPEQRTIVQVSNDNIYKAGLTHCNEDHRFSQ